MQVVLQTLTRLEQDRLVSSLFSKALENKTKYQVRLTPVSNGPYGTIPTKKDRIVTTPSYSFDPLIDRALRLASLFRLFFLPV